MHRARRWLRQPLSRLTSMVGLTLLLAACGGGGGGGGETGGGGDGGVAVPAVPARFTLGGGIGGLTEAGLTLANGTDSGAVTANAIGFTLPTALTSGSPFNVTVRTQPAGQSCSVAGGSGTMGNASVAISGNTIVAGARREDSSQTTITNGSTASPDNSASSAGAAYVFVFGP